MTALPTTALSAPRRDHRPDRAAVERARLSLVPQRRARAGRLPFVALVTSVLIGGIVGLLCFNTQMQQASFAATTLQDRATALDARAQTLHEELLGLRNPQRIALRAQQAGMVIPSSACTLDLRTGRTTTGCAAAGRDATPRLRPRPPTKPAVLDPRPHVVVVSPPATFGAVHHTTHDTTAR